MTNPAAQPRRLLTAGLAMLTLLALVVLLATGHLLLALGVGAVGLIGLVAGARPTGEGRGGR